MPLRTLDDALAALAGLTNYERTRADGPRAFDLSRPKALLAALGRPDRRMGPRVVQVAGTKGKGSTARFAEGALRAAGRRTGLFTSPHLESPLERIAVLGRPIEATAFARAVETVLGAVRGETTFFEALLAAACVHFAEQRTDAVVLEVGLGGRLDATTAVPTTHTVVTSIGLDHTEILGTTIEEVAAEKAATIRPGVPVWSGVDPATPAGAVIRTIAAGRSAPFHFVPPPAEAAQARDGDALGPLRTLGRHQAHNAALAAAACADLPPAAVRTGLAATEQPACCEPRDGAPVVVLDGAHTVESVAATLAAAEDAFPARIPRVGVLALAVDKNLDGIARLLAGRVDRALCTRADDRRGRDPADIAAHPAWAGRARVIAQPAAALDEARRAAGPGGLVLVTGSLYLAGALRARTAPWPWRESPEAAKPEK